MKLFLTYTALLEALAGIALMAVPSKIVPLLFETSLNGTWWIFLAMIASGGIFSLSVTCWVTRNKSSLDTVKMLLVYNLALTLILLNGVFGMALTGFPLWLVIIFHFLQTIITIRFLQNIKSVKNKI